MSNDLDDIKQSIEDVDNLKVDIQLPRRKQYCRRDYSNLFSGIVFLLASVLLFSIFLVKAPHTNVTQYHFWLYFFVCVVALLALIKGFFTLFYHHIVVKYDQTIYKFLLTDSYNQLLLTYERMLWLWVLGPIIIITSVVVFKEYFCPGNNLILCSLIIVFLYAFILFFFTGRLWKKMKYWKNEIVRLKNESDNG